MFKLPEEGRKVRVKEGSENNEVAAEDGKGEEPGKGGREGGQATKGRRKERR